MKLFKKNFYIIGEKPQTDWRRVLITTAILVVVASSYSVVFYHQIVANDPSIEEPVIVETTNATSTAQVEVVGGKLELGQIIELYSKKKENFDKMVTELKKS